MNLTGIVLAAGLSTRMGRPKQDEPLGDTTMLGWAVRAAEASTLDAVVVVVGPDTSRRWARTRASVVVNEAPQRGSAGSLGRGIEAAGDGAVMVLLADMPGLPAAIIDTVAAAWRTDQRWAAVAQYRDGRGHPLILSPEFSSSVREKAGDKVLWPMLEAAAPQDVLVVGFDHRRPVDVNTPRDLREAARDLGLS